MLDLRRPRVINWFKKCVSSNDEHYDMRTKELSDEIDKIDEGWKAIQCKEDSQIIYDVTVYYQHYRYLC